MDCIVVSDDENNSLDDLDLIHASEHIDSIENSSSTREDELLAIQFEINNIDEQIDDLRSRRFQLAERQKQIQQTLEAERNSSKELNSVEKWQRKDFSWSEQVQDVLEKIFKINNFRPWQLETINVAMASYDCILIMPTGGGKSLCYQLPAVISQGISIVVSPLISLVDDQVYALKKLKVDARSLNTSTPREEQTEIMKILDGRKTDDLKILYLTPEKIAKSKTIMSKLQKLYETQRFARLVVDEVHCVSQFGHDFRPDYKYLSIFKRQFPKVPILGLTATATSKVIHDVQKILNIRQSILFRAPFNRKNLFYEVVHKSDVGKNAFQELVHCIQQRFNGKSGIVYCLSQKDAEEVCTELQRNGVKAGCYHAGLTAQSRSQVHERWLNNRVHVICATIAFGMGIDKPDVRFVIHHSLSKSIENFYQESGRAGRDDQQSHCILYFRFSDVFRLAPMAFSDKSGHGLTNLYSMISYCLNESNCRRKLIAQHFDEVWESADCKQMCDVCARPKTLINRRNCREEALSIIAFLEQNKKQRLTPLKLVEQLSIKSMIKIDLQRLVLQMIIDQYLREDFHFTPYNTICYVVAGPKARLLNDPTREIFIDLIESTKKRSSTNDEQVSKKKKLSTPQPIEVRQRIRWTTNLEPKTFVETKQKPSIEIFDDESIENVSITAEQRPSVIDDEELDFL